jgi:hypothetical protein
MMVKCIVKSKKTGARCAGPAAALHTSTGRGCAKLQLEAIGHAVRLNMAILSMMEKQLISAGTNSTQPILAMPVLRAVPVDVNGEEGSIQPHIACCCQARPKAKRHCSPIAFSHMKANQYNVICVIVIHFRKWTSYIFRAHCGCTTN